MNESNPESTSFHTGFETIFEYRDLEKVNVYDFLRECYMQFPSEISVSEHACGNEKMKQTRSSRIATK
jgi:hypothetical protein